MWWQGENRAPEIVKQCIASMRHSGIHVIVISAENVHDYIGKYPDPIEQGLHNHSISIAHLSDFIRFSLLSKYGGLWLDSTILVCGRVPEEAFTLPFYTFRQEGYINPLNRGVWWKAFVLGANSPSNMFSLAREILIRYWTCYDTLIDYYLVDAILQYVLSLPQYSGYKIKIPTEKQNIYWLEAHAADTWKDDDEREICFINKLDYKKLKTMALSDDCVLHHTLTVLNLQK